MATAQLPDQLPVSVIKVEETGQLLRRWLAGIAAVSTILRVSKEANRHAGRRVAKVVSFCDAGMFRRIASFLIAKHRRETLMFRDMICNDFVRHMYIGYARVSTDDQPQDGFLFLDRNKFAASFAADVDPEKAAFMADSQVPWGLEALSGTITEPAWKTKPSWYLVATDDKMIPPDAQRAMSKRAGSTVVEAKGSHAIYVSQPKAVAALIEQAAKSVKASAAA